MSNSESRDQTAHDVVLLSKQGMSRRAIARSLKISRNTVKDILGTHQLARSEPHSALVQKPRLIRASKLDSHRAKVDQLLKDFPDITAQRVFEEVKTEGFTGGYTAVKKLLRKVRPPPTPKASQPTTLYEPGEMAENDWSPYLIPFTHAPHRTLQGFSYALVNSHRKRYSFHDRSDVYALMDGHVKAFEALGGLAKHCKYDNQKPVVLRWEGPQPIYNPRFVAFATYYEFLPVACRPKHPNDKPRVERSFWELELSFFNGRTFRDEADLHAQLDWWMTNICDQRPQRRSARRTPIDLFREEQPKLRPLPGHAYDTARVLYRLCDLEGYVAWDGNWYSVPYDHVTDLLPVRVTAHELFVYAADLTAIARHELRRKGVGEKSTLPAHRPQRVDRPPDLDQLRVSYLGLGDPAALFLAAMERALSPRLAAHHARRILLLRERFDTGDVVAALLHAEAFGAFEHQSVERILLARATPRRLEEYLATATARKLELLLAKSNTGPRELVEYDLTPTQGMTPCPEPQPSEIPPTSAQQSDEPNSSKDSTNTSSDSDSTN